MFEGAEEGARLPDGPARALYLRLLEGGGLFQLADVPPDDLAALVRLREAGLVKEQPTQPDSAFWTVVSPRSAGSRLSVELRGTGIELLFRADELSRRFDELTWAYDQATQPAAARSVTRHLNVTEQIQQRLQELALECTREVLMMQPGGRRPARVLPSALAAARDLSQRGIAQRVIYQPGSRRDRATANYAASVTGLGGRVRVLDEDFRRVVVFDRRVAVIAGYQGEQEATFIEDPVLVDVVVSGFERDWARAERVRWEAPAEEAEEPLAALLARGLTQGAIAKRVGLSERTVAAQIAALRERYDAETLFQLGWLMRADAQSDNQG
ncbi:LuxR family transcriptional regulator [Kitasatospora sp. NBC_01302]|uniref:LuxR family transcriptional regulator n=1 Tax=Kitasatospora sp. NBC_01302 TaxID=2903575 RepID=UPI002E1490F5|nr:LuxR family transcriptional regulator [Kitasatospora sp. NBC_01302]